MSSELEALAHSPPGHGLRRFFSLEPSMHFLNHGSFGATPRHVLAAQDAWRQRMESQPVRFMVSELPAALRAAAAELAGFLGAKPERLAFVANATDGVNAVLRSLPWNAGDEVVIANHAYPAVRNSLAFVAERHGLHVRQVVVPFPLESGQVLVDAYAAAISERTRLVVVDHIFSPLAIVSPVAAIVAACRRRGVPVLVDGAHAPGMLSLELEDLGADWYVGNCHKWLFAPKGCAFLFASARAAHPIHPTVISNFHGAGFPQEFDWQGTRDPSGWLAVTAALELVHAIGAELYRRLLREQARAAAQMLCEQWNVSLPAPADLSAAMVTLPLPGTEAATEDNALRWHDLLWNQHRIEVPILALEQRLWVRISAQIYNELSDYQALAAAVAAESKL